MLLKLAVRNMRRSLRDYAIYFVTLLIAVTVFYAFNSVGDQQVMHDIAASNNANVIEFTGYMMNIFSVIVALVLGFLVIYANQLLITRRKREFGIYLVLGMRPGQVSRILLYETVFIGLGSLVLGLGLGILISQLLSFATSSEPRPSDRRSSSAIPGYASCSSPSRWFSSASPTGSSTLTA